MKLLVTVDTEEEGLWSGSYPADGLTVENVRQLGRFQQLCDRYAVRPTYLVDHAVCEDESAVELLADFQSRKQAEIGSHLHPWCAPPERRALSGRETYLCNWPAKTQRAKIEDLSRTIQNRFGCRPTSFRAGRYGLDVTGKTILEELGYTVDSSVIPYTSYAGSGGPDFGTAPCVPYYPGGDTLLHCADPPPTGLLEVPVTVGYSHRYFDFAHRLRSAVERSSLRRFRAVGVLDRLGLARRIKLSPEQASFAMMRRLVDIYHQRQSPCVVLLVHSTSLSVGYSPYAQTQLDLDQLFERMEQLFAYCRSQHWEALTLSDFAERFRSSVTSLSSATSV